MPAIGDQHRLGPGDIPAITANPYMQSASRADEYTPEEVASLKNRLNKQLGPEFLSSRPSGGGKVHYVTADKCINLANEIFGFNGWSSSIQNISQDFADEHPHTGRVSVGLSVIMRVTLKDGTFHEDIGYGQIENCKGKASAFEKAKKEATTDALKRTLRTFGNVLGNCLYDKAYLSNVVKVKAAPVKFDVENLHRHVDFVPPERPPPPAAANRIARHESQTYGQSVPQARIPSAQNTAADESMAFEFEGEFGSDVFDEADFAEHTSLHPDEIVLEETDHSIRPALQNDTVVRQKIMYENKAHTNRAGVSASRNPPPANIVSAAPSNNLPSEREHRTNNISSDRTLAIAPKTPVPTRFAQERNNLGQAAGAQMGQPNGPQLTESGPKFDTTINNMNKSPGRSVPPTSNIGEDKRPEEPVIGFFSARAAEALINDPYTAAKSAPAFDPQFDSPSIRKTAGIDHSSSSPIVRKSLQALQQPPTNTTSSTGVKGNGLPPPNGGPSHTAGAAGRPPNTSYRPPMRRSMVAANSNNNNNNNNATNHTNTYNSLQQNEHGKRPPLVVTTNVVTGSESAKNQPDALKKTRLEESKASKANLQGKQQQRPSYAAPPGNVK